MGRLMTLVESDPRGFVFFGHSTSKKGEQMEANPNVSAVFYWPVLYRQVRITGKIEKLTAEESDKPWLTKKAWGKAHIICSDQAQRLDATEKADLMMKISDLAKEIEVSAPEKFPRPDNWGGYRIVASEYEFWQGQSNRSHDRFFYTKDSESNEWNIDLLAP